jgi:hypothetical protein
VSTESAINVFHITVVSIVTWKNMQKSEVDVKRATDHFRDTLTSNCKIIELKRPSEEATVKFCN